ncbi:MULTISPECIES: anthranilate synthase component II [Actinomycetes]|uniref:Gamma-glutamyl-gamma-aminobutyrate hydrolase family protein n=2 Tax=Actinomycetes TaxID=1760 RepID=A0ABP6M871_9MICC|nr:gamma-glutamyl-gamma-aminobutyrate hydrolase family protein [Nesterenkonia sp. CL21]MDS2174239.1 gamma-glutamyl-gamma-aminobutyrate hydrolase family protein [Nesterenkonia sp. CL21]
MTENSDAAAAFRAKILVVDNYDSFVYTLVGYLRELEAQTTVIRNDDLTEAEAIALAGDHDGVLISPGPGAPHEAGVSIALTRWCAEASTPLLGVCLGHQGLGEAFGGTVTHAEQLMHGKTSEVTHTGHESFAGLPETFVATRYHSLVVAPDSVPEVLEVTATTDDGVIMGLAHRTAPLWGMQYHPESVLTEGGYRMLGNWLESLGQQGAAEKAARLNPIR